MALFRSQYCSYSRIDEEEDPEERQHLQARFLIYKVLEEADLRQRRASRRRACRYRKRIGLRLKRLRVIFCRAGTCLYRQVLKQVKHLKPLLAAK